MDAFTWYAAAHRNDFTFRTKMFGGFPRVAKRNTFKLKQGKWYTMEVNLSTTKVSYSIDGKHFATSGKLKTGDIPAEGYVGMISYASSWSWKDFQVGPGKPTCGGESP